MQRKFSRSFDELEGIFEFTESFFVSEEVDARHRHPVNFAIEEIFTNMVKYNAGSTNEILICLDRVEQRLTISLTDFDVEPFDITEAKEADVGLPLEERTPGGLGIQLTKRMMDRVDYEYADRQSKVTLTKVLG